MDNLKIVTDVKNELLLKILEENPKILDLIKILDHYNLKIEKTKRIYINGKFPTYLCILGLN